MYIYIHTVGNQKKFTFFVCSTAVIQYKLYCTLTVVFMRLIALIHSCHRFYIITLAAKRRRKGMVIILCVCVCVFAQFSENYEHWWLQRAINNKRLLLKPFGYKVISIFITHGYCFQT